MTAAAAPKSTGGDGARFGEAFERLRDSRRYQTEMEAIEPVAPPETPGWLRWLQELFGGAEGPFELLAWGAAAIVATIVLYVIGRRILDVLAERRARTTSPPDTADWLPEVAPARALLDEADALAARGDYAKAAHLLLLRGIEDIAQRLPDFLRPALTSRDIARAQALPANVREPFAAIAAIVERGIFASRPVGKDGWAEARRAYGQFAFGQSAA